MNNKAYTKHTNKYDDVLTGRKWWSKIYMNMLWKVDGNAIAKEILDMIDDDFSGKILDIPVGTAVFTTEKYQKLKYASIVGVDYSQEMIDIAKKRKDDLNISNLSLQQGDITNLKFENNSFDIVMCMNGFHCFPNKEKAFSETYRVLKPGGMFCGNFYIKGQNKNTDWFVRKFLNKKGFFIPPHYTLESAKEILTKLYGINIKIKNYRSTLLFKAYKD